MNSMETEIQTIDTNPLLTEETILESFGFDNQNKPDKNSKYGITKAPIPNPL